MHGRGLCNENEERDKWKTIHEAVKRDRPVSPQVRLCRGDCSAYRLESVRGYRDAVGEHSNSGIGRSGCVGEENLRGEQSEYNKRGGGEVLLLR